MLKKAILLVVGIGFSVFVQARVLPKDLLVGVYRAGAYPEITIVKDTPKVTARKIFTLGLSNTKKTVFLPVSIRILDEKNRFITWGRLPQHLDKAIAIELDNKGDAKMIWILTPEERAEQLELAKAKAKALKESKD